MKNLLKLLLLFAISAFGQTEVKRKITDNDPATGKKMVAFLTNAPLGITGAPSMVQFLVKFKETDETTDAAPPGNTDNQKRTVQSYESTFVIDGRKIHATTRLYLADDSTDPQAITLSQYFATKAVNTFPGVANADPLWELSEGILREVILIKQANGELPQ